MAASKQNVKAPEAHFSAAGTGAGIYYRAPPVFLEPIVQKEDPAVDSSKFVPPPAFCNVYAHLAHQLQDKNASSKLSDACAAVESSILMMLLNEPARPANFILDPRKLPCEFIMHTMKFFIFAATECKRDGTPFLKRPTHALRQPMILGALCCLHCDALHLGLIEIDPGFRSLSFSVIFCPLNSSQLRESEVS